MRYNAPPATSHNGLGGKATVADLSGLLAPIGLGARAKTLSSVASGGPKSRPVKTCIWAWDGHLAGPRGGGRNSVRSACASSPSGRRPQHSVLGRNPAAAHSSRPLWPGRLKGGSRRDQRSGHTRERGWGPEPPRLAPNFWDQNPNSEALRRGWPQCQTPRRGITLMGDVQAVWAEYHIEPHRGKCKVRLRS